MDVPTWNFFMLLLSRLARGIFASALGVFGFFVYVGDGDAYEIDTHASMTFVAVEQATPVLRARLAEIGLAGALGENFYGLGVTRSARGWIVLGSQLEDFPTSFPQNISTRSRHHFHDPLKPFFAAGLSLFQGESSIRWALQNPQTGRSETSMSWPETRRNYLLGLTAMDERDRRDFLRRTFKGLGHIMHLVQDSSVPAHVRDDPHLPGDSDDYHAWVSKNWPVDRIRTMAPLAPHPDLLGSQGRENAIAPIGNLIDFDRYDQSGSNRDLTTQSGPMGLAEFANANFFSEDRTLPLSLLGHYPNPDLSDRANTPFVADSLNPCLGYRQLIRNGQIFLNHLARERSFGGVCGTYSLSSGPIVWIQDDLVHSDYAQKLLPRAVGYSKALLEYFFRGQVNAKIVSGTEFEIENISGEVMSGNFKLYYDYGNPNPYRSQVPGASWTLTIPGRGKSAPQSFTPPNSAAQTNPGKYMLVFEGTLGAERNIAVVGRLVDLPTNPAAAVRLSPYGSVPYTGGPFRIEAVDKALAVAAAPEDISVTLLRQVFSQCRGLLFSSNRTVTVAKGETSSSYDFTAAPDPFCNTQPIRTELSITGAVMGAGLVLDLTAVPVSQRSVAITR